MSNRPIADFMLRMHTYQPEDVALLFGLIAYQEASPNGLIPATVENRIWCVDLLPEQIMDSLRRLQDAGEVVWQTGPNEPSGYRVKRYEELVEAMTDFGQRRYNRIKVKEHRKKSKELAST